MKPFTAISEHFRKKCGKTEPGHVKIDRQISQGYIAAATSVAAVLLLSPGALAADDPISIINNLSTFVFSAIRAIGLILLGMGILQFGLSLKNHDPSQRATSLLVLLGGIIITFSKEILDLITGGGA